MTTLRIQRIAAYWCATFIQSSWRSVKRGVLTLSVADVELVYLLCELVLLNGLSPGNRKGETPLKVLHLVHGCWGTDAKRKK